MDPIKRIDRLLTIFEYEEYPHSHLLRLKDGLLTHIARIDDRLEGQTVDYMRPFKDQLKDNLERIRFDKCSTNELLNMHKALIKYAIQISEELNDRLDDSA